MMFIISDAKSYSHADFLSIKCASLLFSSLSHIGMHVCCYTSGHCCPNLVPIPTGQSLEDHHILSCSIDFYSDYTCIVSLCSDYSGYTA